MCVVVDSNIVKNHFENEISENHNLTHEPYQIFEMAGEEYKIFLDKNGMIEKEWEGAVETEWFQAFLARLLEQDAISYIQVDAPERLYKILRENGFPTSSRDIWYVRTSYSLSNAGNKVHLVTEDLDFYEPSKKDQFSGQDRIDFMLSCKGRVSKVLMDEFGVATCPVRVFLGC